VHSAPLSSVTATSSNAAPVHRQARLDRCAMQSLVKHLHCTHTCNLLCAQESLIALSHLHLLSQARPNRQCFLLQHTQALRASQRVRARPAASARAGWTRSAGASRPARAPGTRLSACPPRPAGPFAPRRARCRRTRAAPRACQSRVQRSTPLAARPPCSRAGRWQERRAAQQHQEPRQAGCPPGLRQRPPRWQAAGCVRAARRSVQQQQRGRSALRRRAFRRQVCTSSLQHHSTQQTFAAPAHGPQQGNWRAQPGPGRRAWSLVVPRRQPGAACPPPHHRKPCRERSLQSQRCRGCASPARRAAHCTARRALGVQPCHCRIGAVNCRMCGNQLKSLLPSSVQTAQPWTLP
jgi:hypothetical protein